MEGVKKRGKKNKQEKKKEMTPEPHTHVDYMYKIRAR